MNAVPCRHCYMATAAGIFHSKVCRCGHHHTDHAWAGGCKTKDCKCDHYDQTERTHTVISKLPTKYTIPGVDLEKLAATDKDLEALVEGQKRVDALKQRRDSMS